MNEIKKECKKHGELTPENIYKKGRDKQGRPYYACLICKHEIAKRYNENNFDRIKEKKYIQDQRKKIDPEWKEKKKRWMKEYNKRVRNENS